MKITQFSKLEKLKLIGNIIKAITGIAGISTILTENHPYIAIGILCVGAAANEVVSSIKEKENKQIIATLSDTGQPLPNPNPEHENN